jgi:hypothetical protein
MMDGMGKRKSDFKVFCKRKFDIKTEKLGYIKIVFNNLI